TWRASLGLPSSDADGVDALSDDRIAVFGDHAKVARPKMKVHFLAGACFQVNTLKATKSNARRSLNVRKFEVKLDYLVAAGFTVIHDSHVGVQCLPGADWVSGKAEPAVGELRVAESISKRIERFAGEVAIG